MGDSRTGDAYPNSSSLPKRRMDARGHGWYQSSSSSWSPAKGSPFWVASSVTMKYWSKFAQLCLTLCDSMDCSLPGSSHGIFQARVLEWVASHHNYRLKKWCTTWELWVKFYLGQNEDCSLGGSISALRDCSKAAVGESQYIRFGGLVTKSWPTLVSPWTVPTRILCPWDSPGKNTGVGCYCLLQKWKQCRIWLLRSHGL